MSNDKFYLTGGRDRYWMASLGKIPVLNGCHTHTRSSNTMASNEREDNGAVVLLFFAQLRRKIDKNMVEARSVGVVMRLQCGAVLCNLIMVLSFVVPAGFSAVPRSTCIDIFSAPAGPVSHESCDTEGMYLTFRAILRAGRPGIARFVRYFALQNSQFVSKSCLGRLDFLPLSTGL